MATHLQEQNLTRAGPQSALRTLLVLPLWWIRLIIQGPVPVVPRMWTLLFDVFLVAVYFWTVWPLLRDKSVGFPNPRHWTGILWTPVMVAMFILLRDLYFFATGTPL